MVRSGTALFVAVCACGLPTSAAAQEERRVELTLEDCLGADALAVRRIVAAELGPVLLGGESGPEADAGSVPDSGSASDPSSGSATDSSAPTARPDVTHARVECGVESAVVVVEHRGRSLRFEQRVDLTVPAPNARGRLLALSIVELVASTWATLDALPSEPEAAPPPAEQASPEPEPEPEPPMIRVIPAAAPLPEPPPARAVGVRIVGALRVAGTPVHPAGGGGIGVDVGLPFSFGIGADLRYEYGRASASQLVDVAFHALWGSLLALVRPIVGHQSLTLGIGARIGAAWLEGIPRPGGPPVATHAGVIAGPSFAASTALHLAGMGYAWLALELSWLTLSISGTNSLTGEEIARFGGPQIALVAGFEIQPADR